MEKDKDKCGEEAGMELSMIRKNLLNVFAKEEANLGVGEEHMKVFLRIRPLNTEDPGTKDDQGTLQMIDDHVVLAHAPPDSHAYRNKAHGRGRTTHKFTFSRVFPEPTTQKEFFDSTMLGFTRDFIDGQNCLVFTYGITSSGKTYTIQGTPNNAGLLPRTLDVLFNSIADRQWGAMDLKPHMFIDVERLSKEQEETERKIKERVLRMRSDEAHDMNTLMGETEQSYLNTTSASDGSTSTDADHKDSMDVDLLKEVENRVRESTAVSVEDQGQIRFSIWVSFAEIYNEQIFDLLEPIPKKKNARRTVLKLSEDRNGSPYVKGLKEINVTSADEAYRLLTIGQSNLRIACTRLNHVSSRSHCIFNIKIVRVLDKENPHVARVSMLSLCDLAGSERYSKTLADNERLKEAGNINCSLHTLGRCIETLRYNQNHKENSRIIPFRDSKLTRLFQNFFNGRGKAAMVVNVNPCSSMFDETLTVFKFSAIAKQVVLHQADPEPKVMLPPKAKKARAPTIAWEAPTPRTAKFRQSALEEASCMPLPEDDDDDLDEEEGEEKMMVCKTEIEELVNENDQLRQMLLDEKREKVFLEMKIRDEVVKEMSAQFVEIENRWRERNRETEELAEERAEKRVQMFMDAVSARKARKRRREEGDEEAEEDLVPSALLQAERTRIQDRDRRIQELETELSAREERVASLEGSLAVVRKQCEELTRDKTALEFQCADSRRRKSSEAVPQKSDEALASLKQENEKLQSQIAELEEKIKVQGGDRDLDALSQQQLLEALGTKLSDAKAANKEQAEEIEALNEMLNEAGETFQQQRSKIETLEASLQERDAKILEQAELIRSLQQLVSESKAAMEESDQRLTARQQRIGSLEAEVNTQRGSPSSRSSFPLSPGRGKDNTSRFLPHSPVGRAGLSLLPARSSSASSLAPEAAPSIHSEGFSVKDSSQVSSLTDASPALVETSVSKPDPAPMNPPPLTRLAGIQSPNALPHPTKFFSSVDLLSASQNEGSVVGDDMHASGVNSGLKALDPTPLQSVSHSQPLLPRPHLAENTESFHASASAHSQTSSAFLRGGVMPPLPRYHAQHASHLLPPPQLCCDSAGLPVGLEPGPTTTLSLPGEALEGQPSRKLRKRSSSASDGETACTPPPLPSSPPVSRHREQESSPKHAPSPRPPHTHSPTKTTPSRGRSLPRISESDSPIPPTPSPPRSRSKLKVKHTEQHRVLRVLVTPIVAPLSRLVAKHTKTSMLRMRTPTRDGEPSPKRLCQEGKENRGVESRKDSRKQGVTPKGVIGGALRTNNAGGLKRKEGEAKLNAKRRLSMKGKRKSEGKKYNLRNRR